MTPRASLSTLHKIRMKHASRATRILGKRKQKWDQKTGMGNLL